MDWTYQVYESLIPSPPKTKDGLAGWLEEYNATSLLDTPAWALERTLLELAPAALRHLGQDTSIADLLSGKVAARSEKLKNGDGEKLREAAREYLHKTTLDRSLEQKRKEWWSTRPQKRELQLLSLRTRELMRQAAPLPTLEEGASPAEPVVYLDHPPLQVYATFRETSSWDWDSAVEARLDLIGFEHSPIRARCTSKVAGHSELERDPFADDDDESSSTKDAEQTTTVRYSYHVRQVCAWLLDAIHWTRHPAHRTLRDAVDNPSWVQLIDHLSKWTSDREGELLGNKRKRLAWRIADDEDGRPVVEPLMQKRLKSGAWSRGAALTRVKLDDPEEDMRIEPEDLPVIEAWRAFDDNWEEEGRERERVKLLKALVGYPRLFGGLGPGSQGSDARVKIDYMPVTVSVVKAEGGYLLDAHMGDVAVRHEDLEGEGVAALCKKSEVNGHWLIHELDERCLGILKTVLSFPAVIPAKGVDSLLAVLQKLQPAVHVRLPGDLQGLEREPESTIIVRLQPTDTDGLQVGLYTRPLGEGPVYRAGRGLGTVVGTIGGKRVYCVRKLAEEAKAAEKVERHLGLPSQPAELSSEGVRVDGLSRSLEILFRLKELGDEVRVEWPEGDASKRLVSGIGGKDLQVRVKKAEDWFCVDGNISIEGASVPLSALLRAVQKGQRFVQVGPQHFVRLEGQLRSRLGELVESAVSDGDDWKIGVGALSAAADLAGGWDAVEGDSAWKDIASRISEAKSFTPELPDSLNITLRDYQHEGFVWLSRLSSWGAGACLADEMGLGKTIQATAVLVSRSELGPTLIVAPTSVIQNWAEELKRFTTDIDILAYQGRGRKQMLDRLGPKTALLCSYDVLSRDVDALAETEFATFILDEAQAIKNSRSARAHAARKVNASWRLALTGTPMENHLGELWSLFHVVSPGLLGSQEQFRQSFVVPIERFGQRDRLQVLRKKVAPFLLRRTKEQVAKELPPRTEVTKTVELSAEERSLYEGMRLEALQELVRLRSTEKSGPETQHRFQVLATITKLRRLACHPRLIDDQSMVGSSKLRAFLDLIGDLHSDGHRTLVFSQFTGHLALIREALELHSIPYLYLDGSTPNEKRSSLVKEWQSGDAPVFLISLRAGGTGLNLTGADYVVHLDPWWNPAVEDQASDRAHRIGQTRPVTVVRLVSASTIEESVLQLHKEKRDLARGVLDGADTIAKLSTDELIELIEQEGLEDDLTKPLPSSAA